MRPALWERKDARWHFKNGSLPNAIPFFKWSAPASLQFLTACGFASLPLDRFLLHACDPLPAPDFIVIIYRRVGLKGATLPLLEPELFLFIFNPLQFALLLLFPEKDQQ